MTDQNGIKMLYDAFFAIAESYTTIVYMDISDGRVYTIRLNEFSMRYEEELNRHPVMRDILEKYINDAVYDDDAYALRKLADPEYVTKRLESENPLHHVFRTVHDGSVIYFRLKIVPIDDGKKIVYGFENIDSQFRLQLEINAEKEKQMMLLDGLSREYMSVWYLDGKSRKITLVRNNGSDSENGEPVRIGNTLVDYHFSMQKYFGSFVRPEDFDRLMHETGYDELVKNAGNDDLYSINYIRINPDSSTSHFQVCYAKIVDDTGVANFVFGFRKIDAGI